MGEKGIFSISFGGVYSNLISTIKMMYWKEHPMILMVDNNDAPLG